MDNPNAFKNKINEVVVRKLARSLAKQTPHFDSKKFLTLLKDLPQLELKARVRLIALYLKETLHLNFPEAITVLLTVMEEDDLQGFDLWPISEFISDNGLDHFDESMQAMYQLTQRFTSEFAVRPFLMKNHKKVLKYFNKWTMDKNVHVRRWVSEGTRPLLPWGQKLSLFIEDPTLSLNLLEKLKDDEELYVRKSVANHLNDIAKNHPQVVLDTLKRWQKEAPSDSLDKINWITRHALRTLIKRGDSRALQLMGVRNKVDVEITRLKLAKKRYELHDQLEFSFLVKSNSAMREKLIIDYAIDFVKASGKQGKKVFKLKTLEIEAGEEVMLKKKHSLKPITTMKYYSGTHHLMIQVNGEMMGQISFYLEV